MLPALDDAKQLLDARKFAPALERLQDVLQRQPDLPRAHFMAARALIGLRRGAEAVEHLDACAGAARQAPDPVASSLNLANLYAAAGAPGKAEDFLRHGMTRAPESPHLKAGLADLMARDERWADALPLYRAVARAAPESPAPWRSLGIAAQHTGATGDAIAAYKKTLALDPRQPAVYNNLLAAMIETGQAEDALAYCEQWLTLEPASIEALAFHALLLVETGRRDKAEPLLDFDRLVQTRTVEAPDGYADLDAFNRALETHVLAHPDLQTPPEDHPTWHHPALRIGSYINSGDCGPVKALEKAMHQAVSSYYEAAGEDAGHPFLRHRPKDYRIEAWAAVLEGEGSQQPHIHMDGYLSGCYYVTIPQEISAPENGVAGPVVGGFEVGRPPRELAIRSDFPTRVVKPHEGLMVLFPAYLYHGTIPFESRQRRICIAFDVVPKNSVA